MGVAGSWPEAAGLRLVALANLVLARWSPVCLLMHFPIAMDGSQISFLVCFSEEFFPFGILSSTAIALL